MIERFFYKGLYECKPLLDPYAFIHLAEILFTPGVNIDHFQTPWLKLTESSKQPLSNFKNSPQKIFSKRRNWWNKMKHLPFPVCNLVNSVSSFTKEKRMKRKPQKTRFIFWIFNYFGWFSSAYLTTICEIGVKWNINSFRGIWNLVLL